MDIQAIHSAGADVTRGPFVAVDFGSVGGTL